MSQPLSGRVASASSRFWRGIAIAIVALLACDVGLRILDRIAPDGLPDPMAAAFANAAPNGGGIINTATDGIVTTNDAGTRIYRWGRIDGSPGGMSVIVFDVVEKTIERVDLK